MTKYRKKSDVVEAAQWFKDGDHPAVTPYPNVGDNTQRTCCVCHKHLMSEHGWFDTYAQGICVVCPGDWIITNIEGDWLFCKAGAFEEEYESL